MGPVTEIGIELAEGLLGGAEAGLETVGAGVETAVMQEAQVGVEFIGGNEKEEEKRNEEIFDLEKIEIIDNDNKNIIEDLEKIAYIKI